MSNVERGLASLSVRALYSVVSHSDISMDGLFEDSPSWGPPRRSPRIARGGSRRAQAAADVRLDELRRRAAQRRATHHPPRESALSASPAARHCAKPNFSVHTHPGRTKKNSPTSCTTSRASGELSSKVASTFRWDTTKPFSHPVTRSPSRPTLPHRFWNESDEEVIAICSSSMRARWTRLIHTNRILRACSGHPPLRSFRPVV